MKAKELRSISKKEQDEKLKELRMELIKSKTRKKEIKKTIARILTIKNQTQKT